MQVIIMSLIRRILSREEEEEFIQTSGITMNPHFFAGKKMSKIYFMHASNFRPLTPLAQFQ